MLIEKTVFISATPEEVWRTLTEPERMKQWMGEPEMQITIHTDWQVGSAIVVEGFHHLLFENKGYILHFEPGKKLIYSQMSSFSRLPDSPENYSILEFTVESHGMSTSLTLRITNFPTLVIFKHLEFYWQTTMEIIKKTIEAQAQV